jgi:SAM-dependent methyltransferase
MDGSISSSKIIVPLVLSIFNVKSVVDVGCGVGGWLKVFSDNGIQDYLGIDGAYVPRDQLKIPAANFLGQNLTDLKSVGRRFDLACSLEVAEHLPEASAEQFVGALVDAAPVVLFSAAVPGQGGIHHINEQWPSYWANLFKKRGYVAIDCIRPELYNDPRIEFWYRQNIIVFCDPAYCPPQFTPITEQYELDRVHPDLLYHIQTALPPGSEATKLIWRGVKGVVAAVSRRVSALFSAPT